MSQERFLLTNCSTEDSTLVVWKQMTCCLNYSPHSVRERERPLTSKYSPHPTSCSTSCIGCIYNNSFQTTCGFYLHVVFVPSVIEILERCFQCVVLVTFFSTSKPPKQTEIKHWKLPQPKIPSTLRSSINSEIPSEVMKTESCPHIPTGLLRTIPQKMCYIKDLVWKGHTWSCFSAVSARATCTFN